MNACKTQPLNKMKISPMSMELKNAKAERHPLKTTRIIPTPLALQEEAYKQIENDVNMGILENITNGANHYLWLAPMLIIPKKRFLHLGSLERVPQRPTGGVSKEVFRFFDPVGHLQI